MWSLATEKFKGIKWSLLKLNNKTAVYDMSNVVIKDNQGNEIMVSNEEFELMIQHFNERKQQINILNK